MAYETELMRQIMKRWARRATPRHGEVRDDRPPIRNLDSEVVRGFDNQGLFYDQSGELIPGVDPEPNSSMNFRWSANSGYGGAL